VNVTQNPPKPTDPPDPNPLHVAKWIFGSIFAIAVLLGLLTAFDTSRATDYTQIFNIVFDWPTLGFALVFFFITVYHNQIGDLLKDVYLNAITKEGPRFGLRSEATRQQQAAAPATERGIEVEFIQQSSSPPLEEARAGSDVLEELISRALRATEEASRWFVRYLTVFLSPTAVRILREIGANTNGLETSALLRRAQYEDDFQRALFEQSVYLKGIDMPEHPNTSAYLRVLQALIQYEVVIRSDNDVLHITDEGREFLRFVDSPDGVALLAELEEARPKRYPIGYP
jgi:hypothetical protein